MVSDKERSTVNARLMILVYSGIPLLYMILVVPLGVLVNTEDIIGSHYGRRNAESGRLQE